MRLLTRIHGIAAKKEYFAEPNFAYKIKNQKPAGKARALSLRKKAERREAGDARTNG
jgi:hypothetical protein